MTRKELVNIPGVKNLLNFGKYKGKTILQIIEENPDKLKTSKINEPIESSFIKGFDLVKSTK